MSALSIQPTFPIFTETDGLPLENGYIWIGAANLDPQGNPVQVYWDAALTIAAPQPIRTLNGYPSRNGTPARLYVNSDYSIRVMNKNGSMVYSASAATERYSANLIAFTGFKGQVGTVENLADDDGSDWIGFEPAGASAVARSAQDKMRETVSVKDFGAVGDGVTDDTVAIQLALDNVSAGSTVLFPNGTYLVNVNSQSAPITDGTDVSKCALLAAVSVQIVGDFGAVIKAKEGASPATDNYIISGTASVKINNLEFNGDRLNVTSSYGIQLNASESTVQNCVFKDFDGSPVVAQGTGPSGMIDRVDVSNNSFENNGNTVFLAWVDRFKLNNNTIYNASEGFDLDKYCKNGQINGNSFETFRGTGADAGIEINGGDSITVANNSIRNFKDGIILNAKNTGGADYYSTGITVIGNTVENSTGYGLTVGAQLSGFESLQDSTIVGNVFKNCTIDGVNLRGKNVVFSNNSLVNNARGGLLVSNGTRLVISGNIITDHARYGIQVESASVAQITITSNIIADNNSDTGYNGIQMSDVTSASVSNNTITGAHDHGIRVQGTGTINLSGNTVTGATTGSVRIASTTTWTVNGQNSAKIYPQTNDVFYNGASVYYSDTDPGTLSSSYVFREGDIVWKLAQTAGTSPGWVCVTAGSPGTWKAMANLAV